MALQKYKQKRSFTRTPEPKGGKSRGDDLHFVIQKHDATQLHYDFRLEMGGVLKSWAVPKGPSVDPAVKRLAMMVEDHPYDYKDFEGIIPKGNYGAGTVMVWDQGTYDPVETQGAKANEGKAVRERSLLKHLKAGSLKFTLHGEKLKGEFALVRTKGMGDHSWLLIKHKDRYAKSADITKKDKSVVSGKTLKGIEKDRPRLYQEAAKKSPEQPRGKTEQKPAQKKASVKPPVRKRAVPGKRAAVTDLLKTAKKAAFPHTVAPMLATLVDKPVEQEGWLYEVKWDGYRALGFSNQGKVMLRSRNDKSFNERFYPVYEALKKWAIPAVVDGEIVVVNKKGISDFGTLQNWQSEADGELAYYVFDLLWYQGHDLKELPLTRRKALLASLAPTQPVIRLSEAFDVSPAQFLETAKNKGLEGIMAKRADSRYVPGDRSRDWLKIKTTRRQEVIIGGYTRKQGTPKPFSSLLAGVFDKDQLIYFGKIGTGFSIKKQRELLERFKSLETKDPPFSETPDVGKPGRFRQAPASVSVTWLKPRLICEVNFTEITKDGLMRHPSFEGLRDDKKLRQVIREKEADTRAVTKKKPSKSKSVMAEQTRGRKAFLNPSAETQVRKVNGRELTFTHLNKIFWPDEQLTKRDLINYYHQVASVMLPYVKGRPQSMNRFPNGINGKSFYQKDVTGKVPDWIDTYLYHAEGDRTDKHFLVVDHESALLYMVGLGCIEINPWSSTVKKPDYPTWCIIDLDPDKKNTFAQVIEAARITRQVLDDMQVPSYPKTSGSTGMHIYIPLGAKYTYEQSKEFARVIVTLVHREIPGYTTIERTLSKRRGKMYLDFLQNRPQATIAAPYSLRPKPGATVSMPLHWEEVKAGLKMQDFTWYHALDRIKAEGDIFKPVLGKGINLKKIIQQYQTEET